MIFHTVRWKITSAILLTVLAAIVVLAIYLSSWAGRYYIAVVRSHLEADSRMIGRLAAPLMASDTGSMSTLVRNAGKDLGCRITIAGRNGVVLGDSHHDRASMDRHDNRPEIRQALAEGTGWSVRYSKTLRTRMLYVATRIGPENNPLGVARLSESLAQVDAARSRIHYVFFIATLVTFLVVGTVGARIAEKITGPIQDMSAVARRIAKGELGHGVKVPEQTQGEIEDLAVTLNVAATEIRRMMDELTTEKGKLQTILDKTDDGIMVVDREANVQMANPAAARFLGVESRQIVGRTVIEGTLNHDLASLADRVLRTATPASLEIELTGPQEVFVNAYVAPLEDSPTRCAGAVVVMHDMTAAKRIDSMRRDFVANVSHEFRTPLASIKAMAETILLRGKKDPEAAQDFASTIVTEADRLTAISDDLLDLAKIEAGRRVMRTEEFALTEAASRIVAELLSKAERKRITISLEVSEGLFVRADRDAVCQILSNLVDNAVKYTPKGGKVTVAASAENGRVAISVKDSGIGIPAGDLPRIFERFYRVDKGRSRESGGTGLGLSIVRHLVEAHGGKIIVESSPGTGSTFTFTLPGATDANTGSG